MIPATYTTFSLGVLLHLCAAGTALGYLPGVNNARLLKFAGRLSVIGSVCFAVTLLLRSISWNRIPLTAAVDFINLFVIMASFTALVVAMDPRRRALLAFYFPPLAVLCGISAGVAFPGLSQPPMELSGALLFAHVGTILFAYAQFLIASLTSVAYAYQAGRLKRRDTTGLFQKLPSLETLDRTLYLLIRAGYPVFVAAMILGLAWAWRDRALLGASWWLSPKILVSICMALFYAVCFHARQLGLLRGPKLAYFVFTGFGLLFGLTLLLRALHLLDYKFWGDMG